MASVGRMSCRLNKSKKRQTPTRMPYSCQLQFGTSGSWVCPVGGGSTCRAIGLPISQTSRLTMVQKIRRAPPGSFSGGRSTMAENAQRSRGSIGDLRLPVLRFFIAPLAGWRRCETISRHERMQQHEARFVASRTVDHIPVRSYSLVVCGEEIMYGTKRAGAD